MWFTRINTSLLQTTFLPYSHTTREKFLCYFYTLPKSTTCLIQKLNNKKQCVEAEEESETFRGAVVKYSVLIDWAPMYKANSNKWHEELTVKNNFCFNQTSVLWNLRKSDFLLTCKSEQLSMIKQVLHEKKIKIFCLEAFDIFFFLQRSGINAITSTNLRGSAT